MEQSLLDGVEDAPTFARYDSDAQNVNTGVGSQYNNNSTGNQNNGPGSQYIGTNHIDSSTHHHAAPEWPETPPDPSILILFSRDSDFIERGDILERIAQSYGRLIFKVNRNLRSNTPIVLKSDFLLYRSFRSTLVIALGLNRVSEILRPLLSFGGSRTRKSIFFSLYATSFKIIEKGPR
ncbi:hypothetical protein IF1G_11344 [Cordyceps javanica]|uniref:Uncharacterized protein n=1 Tax=Cordyceps javanica TaxID=43265 RepID=A0A545UKJ3_9HYPO|nr:hypothetical protein IF1G_11344 [Cordyceps javanica]